MIFSEKQKNLLFWVIGLSVSAFFVVFVFGVYYDKWRGEKRVEELKTALENWEREIFNKKAADTVGGKTPSETLDMFISAVEAGDYELASKYFVLEKQEEWKKDLEEVGTAQKLNTLLDPLRNVIYSNEGYSSDKKAYNIHDPIFASFTLYPSGNWKIEEI